MEFKLSGNLAKQPFIQGNMRQSLKQQIRQLQTYTIALNVFFAVDKNNIKNAIKNSL